MARYILRVWMPDKPGSLGRVATAIGSVGASLTGIEILEQERGWAIDELVVEAVESPNAPEKLVAALQLVDGVNVEDVRESTGEVVDARLDALDTVVELMEQPDAQALLQMLVRRVRRDMAADWAAFVDRDATELRVAAGDLPSAAWIHAFLAGSRSSYELGVANQGPDDIAWTELARCNGAFVLGRTGRPFRNRERHQLHALARVVDVLAGRLCLQE